MSEELKCPNCKHDIGEHGGIGCHHNMGEDSYCRCKYSSCMINLDWLKKEYIVVKSMLTIATEALEDLDDVTREHAIFVCGIRYKVVEALRKLSTFHPTEVDRMLPDNLKEA